MKHLCKLEVAGEHLLNIINAVLDLSKIDAGKFELEETSVRPENLLGNVASILQDRASAKHVQLLIEPQKTAAQLVGDPTRLQQALLKLCHQCDQIHPARKGNLARQTG